MKILTKASITSFVCMLLLCSSGMRSDGVEVQSIEPVSAAGMSESSASATGVSGGALASANGQFVAFMSDAIDLTTNHVNGRYLQIFVRDLNNRTIRLVTRSVDGSDGANANASLLDISFDGRFVVFSTAAKNMIADDSGAGEAIFVRDMVQEKTILVSAGRDGKRTNGNSGNAHITPDGRFVVFESSSQNIVEGDTNSFSDIFIRDLQSGETRIVSTGMVVPNTIRGHSTSPVISSDGRYVGFVNAASNQVAGATSPLSDVFIRDLELGQTVWATENIRSVVTNLNYLVSSYHPLLSADGRYLTYLADPVTGSHLSTNGFIVQFDGLLNQSTLISRGLSTPGGIDGDKSYSPSMSDDGKRVVFYGQGRQANGSVREGIFVWDADTRSIEPVSVDLTGTVRHQASGARISANGRYVVFTSLATNLVAGPIADDYHQIYVRDLLDDQTYLVSRNHEGRASEGGDSLFYTITGDGRAIIFESSNADLVENDRNVSQDIFIWTGQDKPIELVSSRELSLPFITGNGGSSIKAESISSDGRFVLFTSFAPNMTSTSLQVVPNLFVRDTIAKTNILVTVPFSETNGSSGVPSEARISSNGRFVVFSSPASNLVANDTNQVSDVFVRDLQLGVTTLVSVAHDGVNSGSGRSFSPSISDDGRFVAFESTAGNLVAGMTKGNSGSDVFVRDLLEKRTIFVSASFLNPSSSGIQPSFSPKISPDGKTVVFRSGASNLENPSDSILPRANWYVRDIAVGETRRLYTPTASTGPLALGFEASFDGAGKTVAVTDSVSGRNVGIILYDLIAKTNSVICTNCQSPILSANGQSVAFESTSIRLDFQTEIYHYNVQNQQTKHISKNGAGSAIVNGSSSSAAISADGRFIAFQSQASNLLANDTNRFTDVFVYDAIQDNLVLVSKSLSGDKTGNGQSVNPSISSDGQMVVFQSFASDLITGDLNAAGDVFLARLVSGGTGDTDKDQMDDAWEQTHFGDLNRNGMEDFDADGLLDWQEWKAGTDPKLAQSGLRTSISLVDTGEMAIRWESVAGKTYQVEVKDSVGGDWMALGNPIRAQGSTSVAIDVFHPGAHRFYRISVR